jgi:hypothetical protein
MLHNNSTFVRRAQAQFQLTEGDVVKSYDEWIVGLHILHILAERLALREETQVLETEDALKDLWISQVSIFWTFYVADNGFLADRITDSFQNEFSSVYWISTRSDRVDIFFTIALNSELLRIPQSGRSSYECPSATALSPRLYTVCVFFSVFHLDGEAIQVGVLQVER